MSDRCGILVIDKPAGMTSAQVVQRVKRALRIKRVGHTGTLDPMATGVLPLCLAQATKIAGYLLAEDKAYEAELELGVETDTLDAQGQVTRRDPRAAAAVDEAGVRRVMAELVGPGEQIPPMYSALRHKGKRLYDLARAGQTVERPPRPVVIHELAPLDIALPRARFFVHCSKGTYVRSLAADIGQRLGCGAHLTALRRVRSGAFTLEQAVQLAEVEDSPGDILARAGIAPADALDHLPAVHVPGRLVRAVAAGQRLSWSRLAGGRAEPAERPAGDTVHRLLLPGGELLALAVVGGDGRLRYERVFTYNLTKRGGSSNLPRSPERLPGRDPT